MCARSQVSHSSCEPYSTMYSGSCLILWFYASLNFILISRGDRRIRWYLISQCTGHRSSNHNQQIVLLAIDADLCWQLLVLLFMANRCSRNSRSHTFDKLMFSDFAKHWSQSTSCLYTISATSTRYEQCYAVIGAWASLYVALGVGPFFFFWTPTNQGIVAQWRYRRITAWSQRGKTFTSTNTFCQNQSVIVELMRAVWYLGPTHILQSFDPLFTPDGSDQSQNSYFLSGLFSLWWRQVDRTTREIYMNETVSCTAVPRVRQSNREHGSQAVKGFITLVILCDPSVATKHSLQFGQISKSVELDLRTSLTADLIC